MQKETKNNYCGLVILNDKLRFVCTNFGSFKDITICKYKKTSQYQMCPFKFEDAHGIQLCNCTKAQKNIILDLNAIQNGLNFAESK
jgi:hypothetical protein